MLVPTTRLVVLVAALLLAPPAAGGELDRLLDDAASALHAGDDARARDLLERASAVDEPTPEVFLALARLELRRGDLRAADATVRRALEIGRAHV